MGVLGTGSSLPERRVSSGEVADVVGVERGWVAERIGVLERRFATQDETSLDFAVDAAKAALEAARLSPLELAAVVLATSTADRPVPGVGVQVQAAIGAYDAVAFDVNAACAGFLVACEIGRGLLAMNPHQEYVLVVASDTYSRYVNPADRRTYPLFGDGAGAVVLGRVPEGEGIFSAEISTDGRLAHYVTGGPRIPRPPTVAASDDHYLKMAGRDITSLVREKFPHLVNDAVKERGITLGEIDHVISHQANPRLVEEVARAAGFQPEQLVVTGDRLANTGAASIPIGLDVAVRDGRVRHGDTILMITFGAGMSWGRMLLQWPSAAPSHS
ncbi:ketoacyl-ACP synthase III [Streptomyces sp. RK31]|uniref:3-oxoacyl-ACP synthase III family protein n=1 Tax=Streptomyces sp. RK31 TaxID=2824892 RepID=UPI0027DC0CEA|nr:ketoacyl-ACP synthase III [Streptomyces sp. RK31]